jgi:hypothetical protein
MPCTCSSRRHPTPLQAISGAASNVMHVCNTHLTFPSNLCRSPPRQASTPRACTRAHTLAHILSTWGTSRTAQHTKCAHGMRTLIRLTKPIELSDQSGMYTDTQTVKPVFMSDSAASSMRLIASVHTSVPHDSGVRSHD